MTWEFFKGEEGVEGERQILSSQTSVWVPKPFDYQQCDPGPVA